MRKTFVLLCGLSLVATSALTQVGKPVGELVELEYLTSSEVVAKQQAGADNQHVSRSRSVAAWYGPVRPSVSLHEATTPDEFDLRRQMRKAGISIPSNVAEGFRRHRQPAYQNHVSIAYGSLGELETQFEVAFRNDLLLRQDCKLSADLLDRVGAMLYRLHESLES